MHWDEKERNAAADFPALAWAVGQLATTKAALELLRRRAACGISPWPEFSEFSCFSCHHELADEEWRRKRPADDPKVRSERSALGFLVCSHGPRPCACRQAGWFGPKG